MTIIAVDAALFDRLDRDADAIEHAMHEGRLVDLGLRTDAEVREQIQISLAQAGRGDRAMAALAAADYCDDPTAFAPRRKAALWRACQLNGREELYWALSGPEGAPAPVPRLSLRCVVPGCLSDGPFDPLGSLPVCVPHRRELRPSQAPAVAGGAL